MKKFLLQGRLALLALIAALVTGCVNRVHEAPTIVSTVTTQEAGVEEEVQPETPEEATNAAEVSTQEEVQEPEEEPAEEDPYASFPKALREAGYDDMRIVIKDALYAVRDGSFWSIVNKDDEAQFDDTYDYFATDGEAYFSLTVAAGEEYVSRLYYRNPRSKEIDEIFVNDEFPEMDIVEIEAPYLRMGARTRNGEVAVLPALYLEWEDYGNLDYEFYILVHLSRNNVAQGGFDPDRWAGLSFFADDISTVGGIFIDCAEYYFDPATDSYYNIVGCTANNQILFSEDEDNHTVEILPLAPTADGYYAGYVINTRNDEKTLSYGNLSSGIFSSEEMTAFPEDAESIAPYTGEEAEGAWIMVTDTDGNEKIFDMSKGEYVED